jgi:hypothetical protein
MFHAPPSSTAFTVGRLLVCRVPYHQEGPGSPDVAQFPPISRIDHRKQKKTVACQIIMMYSSCCVLPCTNSNVWPFTAVVRHFKLPLPRCARSDLRILTHLHPSFGHEQTMRVYQASLLLPSVISPPYRAFRWVTGVRLKQPSSQTPRYCSLQL